MKSILFVNTGKVVNGETDFISPSHNSGCYQYAFRPVFNEKGEVEAVACSISDATEFKKIEQSLGVNEEQFRIMVDNIPNLAWMADETGWIFWYNQTWYNYTRTTPKQMIGWGWQSVHDPNELPNVMERWTKAIDTGQEFELVFPLKGGDGVYRQFLTRVVPIKDVKGKVIRWFGTNTDVTEQKNTEAELKRLVDERTKELLLINRTIEEQNTILNNKNKELESFNYIASHDLQEPLRKIQTFTGLLLFSDGENLSVKGQQYLERIQVTSKRMQSLIFALLDYSQVSESELYFEKVDLNIVLNDVTELLDEKIDRYNVILQFDKLPIIMGFYQQLTQLFYNLIENAIKYRKPTTNPIITITCKSGKNCWEINVADNGIGFSQEYATKIFKLFQRLHNRETYEGTGIGLSICKKIAENHRGHIMAEGIEGKGATFIVSLPKIESRTTSV